MTLVEKVSVVIPLYNKEKYIKSCLDSINSQKFKNIELIIIDDGSTDSSLKIVEDYIFYDNIDLKIYQQKNSGPSVARNKGIEESTGDIIFFLDADDLFEIDIFSDTVIFFEKYDPDFVEFGFKEFSKQQVFSSNYFEIEGRNNLLKNLLNREGIKPIVWGAAYKISIAKSCKFVENMNWGEDSCYKLDVILNSKKCILIDKSYYINRILNENTLSRQTLDEKQLNSIISYLEYYERELKNIDEVNVEFVNRIFSSSVAFLSKLSSSNVVTKSKGEDRLVKFCKNYFFKSSFKLLKYKLFFFIYLVSPDLFKFLSKSRGI